MLKHLFVNVTKSVIDNITKFIVDNNPEFIVDNIIKFTADITKIIVTLLHITWNKIFVCPLVVRKVTIYKIGLFKEEAIVLHISRFV